MKKQILLRVIPLVFPLVLWADNELLVEERFDYPDEPYGLIDNHGGKGFSDGWMSIERNWTTVDEKIRRKGTNLDQYRMLAQKLPDRFYIRADFKEENEPNGRYTNSLALLNDMDARNGLYFGLENRAYRLVVGGYQSVRGDYKSGQWVTLVVEVHRKRKQKAEVNLWVNPETESDDPLISLREIAVGTETFRLVSPQTFNQEGGELWQDNLIIGKTFESVLE